jgi:hypothetical protein
MLVDTYPSCQLYVLWDKCHQSISMRKQYLIPMEPSAGSSCVVSSFSQMYKLANAIIYLHRHYWSVLTLSVGTSTEAFHKRNATPHLRRETSHSAQIACQVTVALASVPINSYVLWRTACSTTAYFSHPQIISCMRIG